MSDENSYLSEDENLLRFDQQFEIIVVLILNGVIPQGGASLDFIIKTLERRKYHPEKLERMKKLQPLLKEEMELLEMEQTYHRLIDTRKDRIKQIEALL